MADYVKYNGVKNYKLASAILSGYLKLKNGRQTSQSNPIARIASADVVDLYYKNSDIVDEIATNVSTWKTRTKIIQGSVAGPFVMFCMLEKNYPLDFMISFFDNLYDFKYYENETIVNTRDFIRRIYENKDTTQKWLYTVDNTRRILVYAFTNYVQGVSLKKFNAFMVLLRNGTAKDVESIPYYVNIFEQQ